MKFIERWAFTTLTLLTLGGSAVFSFTAYLAFKYLGPITTTAVAVLGWVVFSIHVDRRAQRKGSR